MRELEKVKAMKLVPVFKDKQYVENYESGLKKKLYAHSSKEIVTGINDEFSSYKILSNSEGYKLATQNPFNDVKHEGHARIYEAYFYVDKNNKVDKYVTKDGKTPYINSQNFRAVNAYFRAKNGENPEEEIKKVYEKYKKYARHGAGDSLQAWINSIEEVANDIDNAAKLNVLPENTRLFRMLDQDILHKIFGLDKNTTLDDKTSPGSMDDIVKSINGKAGTVLKDVSVMSTAYRVDMLFSSRPVMLTLLADKGTKCFATMNLREAELLFPKNTRYMIVGAKAHGGDPLHVPRSGFEQEYNNGKFAGNTPSVNYYGLEIICKILNDDEQPDNGGQKEDITNKAAETAKAKEAKDTVKKEENQNRIVAEFARLSQPGQAEKERKAEEEEKRRKEEAEKKRKEEEAEKKRKEEDAEKKRKEEAKKKAEEEEAKKKAEEAKQKAEEEKWDRIAKKELELAKKNNLFIKEVNEGTYYRKFDEDKDLIEGRITEVQDKYSAKYKVMDNATAMKIALKNPMNDLNSEGFKTLYAFSKEWDYENNCRR